MKPKDTAEHYILSSSPHTHARSSVSRIMLDVIIALLPTTAAGIWFFGLPAVWTIATCVATCLVTEALCRLAMKRENTIGDLSAVVTGLLLALNLPAGLPLWMAVVGSVFAIGVAKQVFGGLGMNPFNPALAARAFMLISFTGPMTTWLKPLWWKTPEAMTTATPLAAMKRLYACDVVTQATPHVEKALSGLPSLWDLLVGNMPGCIGEVSTLALALGAAYLLVRKVITWHIPVAFLVTVWLYAYFAGGAPAHLQVLTGGVMIGACFMATDYVTSPTTAKGKLVFGFGCGLLCMLIRQFGAYPEGCSFAILIMNALAPLINRWTQPKPFGGKGSKKWSNNRMIESLTLISGVCAAVLAYVNALTKEPIAATAAANEQKAIKAVLPSEVTAVAAVGDVFVGKDAAGQVVGYAAKGTDAGGYGGDIVLMVGFRADRKTLVCYKTLAAAETPGLGMKLNAPEFADQFAGKDGSALAVKKDGGVIEAITSATITSRAVCRAIADAQKKLGAVSSEAQR